MTGGGTGWCLRSFGWNDISLTLSTLSNIIQKYKAENQKSKSKKKEDNDDDDE